MWDIDFLVTQVTKQHNDDCKKLLRLMGVPVIEVIPYEFEFFQIMLPISLYLSGVFCHGNLHYLLLLETRVIFFIEITISWQLDQAPCEAEAQCAALCKAGQVFVMLLIIFFN